ncbi:alpha-amylase family protein [Cereibacter sediminicola]|uniref:alpha-amylase family protein n=1 Tax=Cereibacter sediminicola TaxID=2584941 RepID=UPI0011A4632B|nr:alpha-amylase family protein [Cereibacter sediminicola]
MDISRTSDVWWKNAVFYCLDVETFQDSNGDGVGDFAGLTRRLDHLDRLGVSCIWLMPFYPSPNHDDGYDVTDYYAVDPRLGTMGDLVEFLRAARNRGMRVIADLVVNHTSREHPWFQAARSDPASPYHDWYVWRDEKPEEDASSLIFPGEEDSSWSWDPQAKKYYLHRFYSHQPDLNVENPAVRDEIRRIVGFWLQLGLSGFRVDAVPFLLEQMSTEDKGFAPHRWLRDLRAFINRRSGEAVLLGEVNLDYPDVRRFFGDEDGDELHMCLDFNLNQAMALALAREDAGPIVHGLRHMPELAADDCWAHFLRNHDEWSLDKLTEAERQEVFASFGPDPDMQLFGRGLRRRMPTMFKGNEARMRMAYALMTSMPGAPVLFYGEEIGMAENLDIPGRLAVRAPMQWESGHNGGFSPAPADKLYRPVVSQGRWAPSRINVAEQQDRPDSFFKFMEQLMRRRRECPEIAFGTHAVLPMAEAPVFAIRHDWEGRTLIAFANLGSKEQTVTCSLSDIGSIGTLRPILGSGKISVKKTELTVELEGYGLRWIRFEV